MQNGIIVTILLGILTATVFPLAKEFLRRKWFPPETDSSNQLPTPQPPVQRSYEWRGQWKGSFDDVWDLVGTIELSGRKITGKFLWKLMSCPNTPAQRLWKKRIGESGYEFIEGYISNNTMHIKGTHTTDDAFLRIYSHTFILNFKDSTFEGNSKSLMKGEAPETGFIRGVLI